MSKRGNESVCAREIALLELFTDGSVAWLWEGESVVGAVFQSMGSKCWRFLVFTSLIFDRVALPGSIDLN